MLWKTVWIDIMAERGHRLGLRKKTGVRKRTTQKLRERKCACDRPGLRRKSYEIRRTSYDSSPLWLVTKKTSQIRHGLRESYLPWKTNTSIRHWSSLSQEDVIQSSNGISLILNKNGNAEIDFLHFLVYNLAIQGNFLSVYRWSSLAGKGVSDDILFKISSQAVHAVWWRHLSRRLAHAKISAHRIALRKDCEE